ncbi:hypothetical protein THIX_60119 [Thiomonas sp. X19]|nr:hypothetical protein THIX_60119 [Thiomonas sp. X19]
MTLYDVCIRLIAVLTFERKER